MDEYIEREALLKDIENDSMTILFDKTSAIHHVKNQPTADVSKIRYGKWLLTVEQGSCYDYHVTACCSECGWEWIGKDNECVGNNRYVFSAFIKGEKKLAEQFALDNAKQRHLYNYCPNCGSKMGDDEK